MKVAEKTEFELGRALNILRIVNLFFIIYAGFLSRSGEAYIAVCSLALTNFTIGMFVELKKEYHQNLFTPICDLIIFLMHAVMFQKFLSQ